MRKSVLLGGKVGIIPFTAANKKRKILLKNLDARVEKEANNELAKNSKHIALIKKHLKNSRLERAEFLRQSRAEKQRPFETLSKFEFIAKMSERLDGIAKLRAEKAVQRVQKNRFN